MKITKKIEFLGGYASNLLITKSFDYGQLIKHQKKLPSADYDLIQLQTDSLVFSETFDRETKLYGVEISGIVCGCDLEISDYLHQLTGKKLFACFSDNNGQFRFAGDNKNIALVLSYETLESKSPDEMSGYKILLEGNLKSKASFVSDPVLLSFIY